MARLYIYTVKIIKYTTVSNNFKFIRTYKVTLLSYFIELVPFYDNEGQLFTICHILYEAIMCPRSGNILLT
jgi:hypothetical protein